MVRGELVNTLARSATRPIRNWWLDVEIENREIVPDFGGAIIAANHLSFIDSMLLMYGLDRPVSFLGKVEYMDSLVTRSLFPAVGMIPVDRAGKGLASSLREARRRLDAGELVGIFPEGTRSRDGRLHPGHSGVAHLLLQTGCPIVPVGITGTDVAQPVGSRALRRAPITIRIGPLIGPGRARGRVTVRDRIALTDEVMASIAALSGQTRAPSVRMQDAREAQPVNAGA